MVDEQLGRMGEVGELKKPKLERMIMGELILYLRLLLCWLYRVLNVWDEVRSMTVCFFEMGG